MVGSIIDAWLALAVRTGEVASAEHSHGMPRS
jgi:hypothetical protein